MNKPVAIFPSLNEAAPAFKAKTTHGDRSLEGYKGQWLILFSHPVDLAPVWTHEFIAFAKASDRLKRMNCELLGLSIENLQSHEGWMESNKGRFGIGSPFPIIHDMNMNVARAYGVVRPSAADTRAVRNTFFIDSEGKLRAKVYHPFSERRSFEELVHLLTAMQTRELNKISPYEGWTPDEKIIVSPPKAPAAIEALGASE